MTSFLKKLSEIDDRIKYGVYGWIREMEQALQLSHIPLMISSICILYYHDEAIFKIIGNNIKLSKDKKCITKLNWDEWDNNNYLQFDIPSDTPFDYIYELELKIKEICGSSGIQIGITNTIKQNIHYSYSKSMKDINYVYWSNGLGWNSSDEYKSWRRYQSIKQDDKVKMTLNLNTAEMIFCINDRRYNQIVYKNIKKAPDIIYKMYVSLYYKNNSVEILNFSKKKTYKN